MHAIIPQVGTILFGAALGAQPGDSQPGIVSQIGTLLVGAVPTMLLFIVLVVAYQLLVHRSWPPASARFPRGGFIIVAET